MISLDPVSGFSRRSSTNAGRCDMFGDSGPHPAAAANAGGHEMPGWYIHIDVARKALASLRHNALAAETFASGGPDAVEVSAVALANPTYVALGRSEEHTSELQSLRHL